MNRSVLWYVTPCSLKKRHRVLQKPAGSICMVEERRFLRNIVTSVLGCTVSCVKSELPSAVPFLYLYGRCLSNNRAPPAGTLPLYSRTLLHYTGWYSAEQWAVGWGSVLQAGRLRVRCLMVSLEFFINIAVDQKHLESFEMWCWRRMEKISWTHHVRNKEVLLRVKEQRNILHEIRKRKANWLGHILRRNCLLQRVTEGKI